MFRLVQLTGQQAGMTVDLNDVQSVGSSPTNQIVVNDPQSSPEQAVIHVRGQSVMLETQQGAAPVLLNGHPVGNCSLRQGDVVTFGSTQFELQVTAGQPQMIPSVSHPQSGYLHQTVPQPPAPLGNQFVQGNNPPPGGIHVNARSSSAGIGCGFMGVARLYFCGPSFLCRAHGHRAAAHHDDGRWVNPLNLGLH